MKTKQNTIFIHSASPVQHISVGDITVEVTRKRVKNVNLRVGADGHVRASAPARVPLSEIERFVASREPWIRAHLARVATRQQAEAAVGSAGSTVFHWGKPYTLAVVEAGPREKERVTVVGEALVMSVRPAHTGDDEVARAHREKLLSTWQRAELEQVLPGLVAHYGARMGRTPRTVRIRRMTSRWGSCNTRTGAITINLALVEYEPACLEGVIVHELCHLFEANHGPRFYALMDRYFPSWPEARAQLKVRPLRRHALT